MDNHDQYSQIGSPNSASTQRWRVTVSCDPHHPFIFIIRLQSNGLRSTGGGMPQCCLPRWALPSNFDGKIV
ncbi:hypothetical protein F441_16933 [Phytophthora nicotianae CJ01A1]|uniref:Uncharacterized protein n=1 Tax=Phytophthora nicotianae CJ01A1 TaxID=1317063 RepID=W2W7Y2_PHYNI|nr:hypothetical protein F441_16933 [Phytophthora nicotianae CJ01A1]